MRALTTCLAHNEPWKHFDIGNSRFLRAGESSTHFPLLLSLVVLETWLQGFSSTPDRPSFSIHFLYLSPPSCLPLFFISPSSIVGSYGGECFQHYINPSLCCLICYLLRFMVFPLSRWVDTDLIPRGPSEREVTPCAIFLTVTTCVAQSHGEPMRPFNKYNRKWVPGRE